MRVVRDGGGRCDVGTCRQAGPLFRLSYFDGRFCRPCAGRLWQDAICLTLDPELERLSGLDADVIRRMLVAVLQAKFQLSETRAESELRNYLRRFIRAKMQDAAPGDAASLQ